MTAIWLRRTAAMRCVPSPTTRTSRPTPSLAPRRRGTTAQAISQLTTMVEELKVSNEALASQVDYVAMMTDTDMEGE